eukprot:COSAG01_NODE_1141_length_11533_cov_588.596152_8_plen_139_part_01
MCDRLEWQAAALIIAPTLAYTDNLGGDVDPQPAAAVRSAGTPACLAQLPQECCSSGQQVFVAAAAASSGSGNNLLGGGSGSGACEAAPASAPAHHAKAQPHATAAFAQRRRECRAAPAPAFAGAAPATRHPSRGGGAEQ